MVTQLRSSGAGALARQFIEARGVSFEALGSRLLASRARAALVDSRDGTIIDAVRTRER